MTVPISSRARWAAPASGSGSLPRRAALAGALLWLITGSTSAAASADAPKRARLVFAAAPCADAEQLRVLVRQRASRVRWLRSAAEQPDGESAQVVVEVFAADATQPWRASVSITLTRGSPTQRELVADDCPALLEAVAFVIALTLDPPEPGTPNPADEPGSNPGSDASPSGARKSNETAPTAPAVNDPEPAVADLDDGWMSRLPAPPTEPSPPSIAVWGLGLGAQWSGGMAPDGALGPMLLGGVEFTAGRHPEWRPALRGSVQYLLRDGVRAELGRASFRWLGGSIAVCPLRFGTESWAVGACLLGMAGALRVSGSDTVEPELHTRPWSALGAFVDAELGLGRAFRAVLGAGLVSPLVQDTFRFESEVVHDAPSWAPLVSLGVMKDF